MRINSMDELNRMLADGDASIDEVVTNPPATPEQRQAIDERIALFVADNDAAEVVLSSDMAALLKNGTPHNKFGSIKVEVRKEPCQSINPWAPITLQDVTIKPMTQDEWDAAAKVHERMEPYLKKAGLMFGDPGDGWTATERKFARDVLEPMLQSGDILWWTDQMTLRLPGQTYTPDFVAMGKKGEWLIYEVKGSYALGSQSRSSVKLRWVKDQLAAAGNVEIYWCKLRKDGTTFRMRQIVNKREVHHMLKEKKR